MKKIMSLLAITSLATYGSAAVYSLNTNSMNYANNNLITNVEPNVNRITGLRSNNILNYAKTIILEDVVVQTETEINLNKVKDKFDDEQFVTKTILMELMKDNKGNKDLQMIIKSVNSNFDDWIVDLPLLPINEGESTTGDLTLMYVGSNNEFDGVLFISDIKMKNESSIVKPDISEVLVNTHVSDIELLTEEVLINQIYLNNLETGLRKDDIKITNINYEFAIAEATKESSYSGNVKITFDGLFNNISKIETDSKSVAAYNSTQSDFSEKTSIIDISLGKSEFLKTYKYMDYKLTGEYKTDHHGSKTLDVQKPSNNNFESYKTDINKVMDYETIKLNGDTSINVFELNYKNVNQERALGHVSVSWLDDFRLEIKLRVDVWVYATAWNAMWARASAKMTMMDIVFS
ncbi:hypothetical protein STIUS_v1c01710 [Spiroplasma sp. TIUS-1]|uniref:hypothetical protein n=1 Tax=Spiroplasma sp. TIUS-1 TaxID=216963 RepID=UPI0013987068|nr:hypothetical protein [Spiroplasma sp. TIUS-1]QHX35726.1 hypothetical protein STIUS_v1c01710 [Spiroplasma sp. TIUS-1]